MNASVNKELLTILLGEGAMLDATDNELSCEKITNKVIAQRQRVFVNSNEKNMAIQLKKDSHLGGNLVQLVITLVTKNN